MSQQRPAYTKEFKEQLLHEALDISVSTTKVALEHGIAPSTLRKWLDEEHEDQFADSGATVADFIARIQELEEEVKILRFEAKFLKQATAYFAMGSLPAPDDYERDRVINRS